MRTRASADQVAVGHILVVEDDRMRQLVVLRMLQSIGFSADVASSGDAAITMAATKRYDLVLMDADMPGMDGYEATRILRELEREVGSPGTPIVGMGSAAARRWPALEAGMDGAIPVPLRATDLRHAVERWLGAADVEVLSRSARLHALEDGGGDGGEVVLGPCADVRDDLGGREVAEAGAGLESGPPA
jgi:two-component system, sensor histidine kinase RetS